MHVWPCRGSHPRCLSALKGSSTKLMLEVSDAVTAAVAALAAGNLACAPAAAVLPRWRYNRGRMAYDDDHDHPCFLRVLSDLFSRLPGCTAVRRRHTGMYLCPAVMLLHVCYEHFLPFTQRNATRTSRKTHRLSSTTAQRKFVSDKQL